MQKLNMAMDMSTFLDDFPIETPIEKGRLTWDIAEDPALDNLQVELMDAQRAESNRGCDLERGRHWVCMWLCVYIYDYVCIWYKNDKRNIVITCICT